MVALEIWIGTALGLFVVVFAGAYVWSLRVPRRQDALSAGAAKNDRWVVLEIERKQGGDDGLLWEVHDNWEALHHREVTP